MARLIRRRAFFWLAGFACLLVGAYLRIYRLGSQLILDDEWHALNVVQDHGIRFISSHFGHADFSIPLSLFYEVLQHTSGLGEWGMRLPLALAGVVTIIAFPLLMRPWLRREERLLTAALLALSPFLVNFSRVARPYALLALLASACLPLAWRWWRQQGTYAGLAWYGCAVVAAWLNPVSLAVTTAPFLWFGASAITTLIVNRNWLPLRRTCVMGLAIGLTVIAMLWAPLSNDLPSLAVKAGVHAMTLETLTVMLGLFAGSGHDPVVTLMASLTLLGWWLLHRRDPAFARYLLLIAGAAMVAIQLSGAEWINYGLVPARYLIGLLPVFLALAAMGLWALLGQARRYTRAPPPIRAATALLVLIVLFLSGPIPGWDLRHGQFIHHQAWQFDYKLERNPIHAMIMSVEAEPFYHEIAVEHPRRDALIVEAPWHLESSWNPLPTYQAVHGQRTAVGFIGDVCAHRLYGELRDDAPGMNFRNFIRVKTLLAEPELADYLVLRRTGIPGARVIDMDFEACAASAREHFGAPWRETERALVFRLRSGA